MRKKKILKEDDSEAIGKQFKWFGLIYEVPTEIEFDRDGYAYVDETEYQIFPVWARNENEAREAQEEIGLPIGYEDEYDGDDLGVELVGSTILSEKDMDVLGISVDDLEEGGNAPEAYSDECATYTEPSPGENNIEDILVGMGLGSDDYMRDEANNKENIYGGYHLVRNNTGGVNLMDPKTGKVILDKWMKVIRPIRSGNFNWAYFNEKPDGRSNLQTQTGRYIAEGTLDGENYVIIQSDGSLNELGDYKVEGLSGDNVILKSKNGYNVLDSEGNLKFEKDVADISPNRYKNGNFATYRKDADGPMGIYDNQGNPVVGIDKGYKNIETSDILGTFVAETQQGYGIFDEKTNENVFDTYFDEKPEWTTFSSSKEPVPEEMDWRYKGKAVILHSPEKGYAISHCYAPKIIGGQWSERPIRKVNVAPKNAGRGYSEDAIVITKGGKEYVYYNNKFIPMERLQNYLNNQEDFDSAEKNRRDFDNLDRVRKQYPGEDYNQTERYFTPGQALNPERQRWDSTWDPYKFSEPKVRNKTFVDKEGGKGIAYDVSDKKYNAARDKMNASKVGNNPWYDTEVPGENKFPENESRANGTNIININEEDIHNMVYSAVKMIIESIK